MPLSLEQYVERLGERTDLPWPTAPKIDPPKAKPHLNQFPVRAVLWTVYGTLVAVPQGELLDQHPQEFVTDAALDKLIKRYLERNKIDKALAILEDLVQEMEDNLPLRARAAQLYLNIGNRAKALEHLDVLGDLQLEAGQQDAAVKTIEAILALNPPNRDAYVDLYKEMTGREPPVPRGTGTLRPK